MIDTLDCPYCGCVLQVGLEFTSVELEVSSQPTPNLPPAEAAAERVRARIREDHAVPIDDPAAPDCEVEK